MSRLERAQVVMHNSEGESVTSTQLTFDNRVNEYLTTHSIAWLIGRTHDEMLNFLVRHEIIMREKNGHHWVNCSDVMWLFGWTPN